MSRKRQQESSLELLLDTICNTFGGVIFLAILVVILVQMTSKSESAQSPSKSAKELKDIEEKRADAHAKLERLRQAAAQRNAMMDQFAKPENRELLNRVQELQGVLNNHTKERSSVWGQTGQSQISANEVAEELRKLDEDLANARVALAAAKEELEREKQNRSKEGGDFSKLRATTKSEIALFLRYGRLYHMTKRGASGQFEFNDADCEQRGGGAVIEVVPKPGAGGPIDAAAADRSVAEYDKDTYYLAVFVWPDTFDQFNLLKDAMVRAGIEYRLEPLPEDGQVFISQQAAGPTQVQ